jgi:hypothetical protein
MASITDPKVKLAFMEGVKSNPKNFLEFCKVFPSDGSSEIINWFGAIADYRKWLGENRYNSLTHEFSIISKNQRWQDGVDAGDTIGRTRLDPVVAGLVRSLGRQGVSRMNRLFWSYIVGGTVTTGDLGAAYDTKAYFAADHVYGGAAEAAFSNILTGSGTDYDNIVNDLYAAITSFSNMYNDAGVEKLFDDPASGIVAVYPIALMEAFDQAFAAVMSASDNTINRYNIKGVPMGLLSDESDWYVFKTNDPDHMPMFHTVVKDLMIETIKPDTKVKSNRHSGYFDVGWAYGDYRSARKINN